MDTLQRYNVQVSGSGTQPMLFAHGFGCDQNMWRRGAPAFEDRYRVVLFDLVGMGRSDLSAYDPKKYANLSGYVDDVLEICAALDLQDVIYVGHSVSAIIGTLAAIREPERFRRLIQVGPSPRYVNDHEYYGGFERQDIDELLELMDANYLGWATAMASTVMGNPDRPELGEELANTFCSTDPVIARQFARVTFLSDNREDLSKLRIPSLVLQSARDLIAPLAVGAYVHAETPNSELVVLDADGHCPHLSAPEATIAAMKRYLEAESSP